MIDPIPLTTPKRRWPLVGMIALTLVYIIALGFSFMFGLLGFMCFDAGVTAQAISMFTMGWMLPIGFATGLVLMWWGYGLKSRRLTFAGIATPLVVFGIFCGYVIIALVVS